MSGLQLMSRGYLQNVTRVFTQANLVPLESQDILVKALDLKEFPMVTEGLGIFQSDVILRTAIVSALADLRANPHILDYVFASLPIDERTRSDYGEKSVQRAKDWFLKTRVEVAMVPVMNTAKAPIITIKQMSSTEVSNEATLGDVHYISSELDTESWPALTQPFTPEGYDPITGEFTVTVERVEGLLIVPGMSVIDGVGQAHEILEVSDTGFKIAPNTVADFRNCVIKGRKPVSSTSLESASYREEFSIGIHVSGEPVYLTWLHSIVVFCLLRYKEVLLEGRGFGRSVVSSSGPDRNPQFEAENVFSRYLTLSGFVRQYWPKVLGAPTIQGITMGDADTGAPGAGIIVSGGGRMAPVINPDDSLYMGDEDSITPPKKK